MWILSDKLIANIERSTTSFWLCNANQNLETDMVRLMGARIEADRSHITVYVPVKQGKTVISNLHTTNKISLLTADVYSYESYQLKGKFLSSRDCTEEEAAFQREYVNKFTDALATQGFPKNSLPEVYLQQPCIALRMLVEEIYEQTPKKGTGKKLAM